MHHIDPFASHDPGNRNGTKRGEPHPSMYDDDDVGRTHVVQPSTVTPQPSGTYPSSSDGFGSTNADW